MIIKEFKIGEDRFLGAQVVIKPAEKMPGWKALMVCERGLLTYQGILCDDYLASARDFAHNSEKFKELPQELRGYHIATGYVVRTMQVHRMDCKCPYHHSNDSLHDPLCVEIPSVVQGFKFVDDQWRGAPLRLDDWWGSDVLIICMT